MIPGSITVRYTCVFVGNTNETEASLQAYFLRFVDENGIVIGSKLGVKQEDVDEPGKRWMIVKAL